jgi:hypothetical protein
MKNLKLKVLSYLLAAVAFMMVIYALHGYFSPINQNRLIHLVNFKTYPEGQRISFDSCGCQVVTYFEDHWPESDQRLDIPRGTMDFIEKYPEICWFFYYAGDNDKEVEFLYNNNDLNQAIIIDTGFVFKELNPEFTRNVSFISAVFYKNGKVKTTNSTMPGYDQVLKDCLQQR